MSRSAKGPCAGLSVIELCIGVSDLGLGMAGSLPGLLLGELGADVVRVVDPTAIEIDADLPWTRVWNRDKKIRTMDDPEQVRALLQQADIALVYGPEELVEGRGMGYTDVQPTHPQLVYVRCRPSRTGKGAIEEYGLLVEARSGFCTQLAGHRPGPIFVNVGATGAGTAFVITAAALGLLRQRLLEGIGGWAETSLYDGMLATLGCLVGRSERAPRKVEDYWAKGSTFPNFLYRCADGELLQVWFGGRGMYAKLIEVLGDEPSTEGYYHDQTTGALNERARRWRTRFSTQPRDTWIERIRAVGVACEPVLAPGDALSDPHLGEIGLAVAGADLGHPALMVGSPVSLVAVDSAGTDVPAREQGRRDKAGALLLEGLHVLDFSAFVAGPLGAQVLADMGADVVKVEPLEGETMRPAAYAMAACQRGKRSLALDLTAPEAHPVVDRLIRWADVVLQNFRIGVAERLGIDEDTVARINPQAVYCHATAFGPNGTRATFPGNDALMQAVTGLERAVGGEDNDPLAPTWIPIDMAGGWTGAIGMLAGLCARVQSGQGQQVATSLLGAGMLLQSGVFQRDGRSVYHPRLDREQTGYGPGYRIYAGADDEWFALVLPDRQAWERLRSLPEAAELPQTYAPLRGGANDDLAREAESVLTRAFGTAPAAEWVGRLRSLDLLVEPIEAMDRNAFRQGILDDPLNRQLGRVAAYETADWGHFEQIGRVIRWERPPRREGPDTLPGIGEHTIDVLRDLGLTADEIDALMDAKVVRQG